MKNESRGITLIALVVTIIVLIILAGVSISLVLGENGIITKSKIAKQETLNAQVEEQEYLNEVVDYLVNMGGIEEGDIIGVDGEVFSAIYTQTETYKDRNGDIAVIPKGFSVGKSEKINTIDNGLVIQDSEGNQFVWIPVEVTDTDTETSIASFYRSKWENNERSTSLMDNEEYVEPYTSNEWEEEEYNAMVKSVYKNKGFYIGRYESGSTTARTDTSNGTTDMVIKRDVYPYNYVAWGTSMTEYTGDVTYNNKNQGKGAVLLSRELYGKEEEKEDYGVVSTLCYGIQWDAMLNFIKDSTHSVTFDWNDNHSSWGNNSDSDLTVTRMKGQYIDIDSQTWTPIQEGGLSRDFGNPIILLTTGASDSFSQKNIFDVVGNVEEWTFECYSEGNRILRGRRLPLFSKL